VSRRGPEGLREMLALRPPSRCRIDYAETGADGVPRCRKCGREVVRADTRSGWRHR
jgi:hypothetical protein